MNKFKLVTFCLMALFVVLSVSAEASLYLSYSLHHTASGIFS